jgi:hypothetical protein
MPLSALTPAPARMKIRSVGKTVSMGRNAKLNQQRPLGATIAEQNFRNWYQMHKTVNIPLCGLKRGSAG